MDRLLHIMTGFSVLLILLVLVSVRRAHIRVEYSVSWFVAALLLLILSQWRSLLERIASAMGMRPGGNSAPIAFLVVTGALFLFVLFRLSVMISTLKDTNVALTQRLAILEYRFGRHEETQPEK
ncbi:MAG TPA: DUF2304 domain-containing protein [Bryobacteraceae bacterium]|nr:DUF2304 domain-containing protein [Bryobacteraceae bacterium]